MGTSNEYGREWLSSRLTSTVTSSSPAFWTSKWKSNSLLQKKPLKRD